MRSCLRIVTTPVPGGRHLNTILHKCSANESTGTSKTNAPPYKEIHNVRLVETKNAKAIKQTRACFSDIDTHTQKERLNTYEHSNMKFPKPRTIVRYIGRDGHYNPIKRFKCDQIFRLEFTSTCYVHEISCTTRRKEHMRE